MKNNNTIALIIIVLVTAVALFLLLRPKPADEDKDTNVFVNPGNNTGGNNTGGNGTSNNAGVAAINATPQILNSIFGFITGIRNNKKGDAQKAQSISNSNFVGPVQPS